MQRKIFIIKIASWCFLIGILFGSQSSWAQAEIKKHAVVALDNYYSLSLKYDISIQELKLANPGILNPKPGDILIIPQKGRLEKELELFDCEKQRKNRLETYRVALMIPFFLEQLEDTLWTENLDPSRINDLAPFKYIQFYHGFMVAVDSLKQEGLKVEIYVYDIDHLTSKALTIIQKPELKKMDLIFGPFFKNSFSIVADFARENKIPIINPLSPRGDILSGNPYVFKLLPSVESQPALLAELVKRDYSGHRILIYVDNKYQNSELIEQYRQAIEQNDLTGKQIVTVVDYATDSARGFRNHASLHEPNLVIIYAENEVLPATLLSKLSVLKRDYQISIIGLPEWEKFTNIESIYLLSLNADIFMSSFTDSSQEAVKGFIQGYRARYIDEPMNFAFSGFDAGYFFLNALLNYGKDFVGCVNELRVPLIQNQYYFERINDGGYDNIYWNILQYDDYKLVNRSVSWKKAY